MLLHSLIVADDSIDWVRLIPFVVIGGIWVLGALASMVKRASGGNRTTIVPPAPVRPPSIDAPPPIRPILPSNLRGAPPARPLRQPPARVRGPIARPGSLAKSRTDAVFASRQADAIRQMLAGAASPAAPRRREPPPPKRRQSVPEPVARAQSDAAPASTVQVASMVDGRSLARQMQPALLRYQFILTEVLRPPLALREDDEGV